MKSRWYTNWLLIITVCLLISSLGIFFVSLKDSIGFTKCAYGDDLGDNCICSTNGEKICDEKETEQENITINSSDFVSTGLVFSYDFLNYIDSYNSNALSVKFSNLSYLGGGFKITLELKTFCSEEKTVAPQIGFYKLEENRLTLTVGSNFSQSAYYIPCVSESTFFISNFSRDLEEGFNIMYQDEYGMVYPANNCVYEGYIRNSGDVYNSSDGCLLCQCKDSENVCEEEKSCLK